MDQIPSSTPVEPVAPVAAEPASATATATAPAPAAAPAALDAKATKAEKDAKARLKDSYERFVERLSVELKEAGKVGKKQWEDALKSTREFVQKARPELKREDIEKVAETVKKDVRHALRTVRERGEDWTRSESFLAARDKGAQFLLKLATRLKDTFESIETNLEETLRYRKGEVVTAGRFVCASCANELTVAEAGALPPCPKCAKEEFRRKA